MSRGYAKSRRANRSAAARIRPFRMIIALAGLVVAAAVAFLVTWPGFYPKKIVVAGNRRVSSSEILARAEIAPNRSLWLENTAAAEARIRAIPDLATVSIHRFPTGTVRVVVTERVPFAILESGARSGIVDRALRVLSSQVVASSLPVLAVTPGLALVPGRFVTSRDALALRDAYETMNAKGIAPKSLAMDKYGDLVATLPNDLRLLLGAPEGLSEKAALTSAILAQVVRGQRRVSAIDLRAPATPVIVYR
jgi:cell division septal protein FtsQ